MTWRSRFIVTLVIALPAPVLAQTVKPENLVGTWARTFKATAGVLGILGNKDNMVTVYDTLIFNADGKLQRKVNLSNAIREMKWSLSADTLWFEYSLGAKDFSRAQLLEDGRKLKLQGGIARVDSSFTRVDSGKP